MPKEDVERFVGLLVSDDTFVEALKRNFDRAAADRNIKLDQRERIFLKEGFETYVQPELGSPAAIGAGSPVAAPVAVAVAAAVAGAVAGSVASKVVDKLAKSVLTSPLNMRIRDSLLHRGLLKETELDRIRDIRELPVLRRNR